MVKDLVKVIQIQRHDFLNHLQVVSGLIQLGKTDRVREYINDICLNMQLISTINRIRIPEIVAALMIGHNLAFEQQVDVNYMLEDELDETVLSGETLGNILVDMQKVLFAFAATISEEPSVNLVIEKLKNDYICRLNVKTYSEEDNTLPATKEILNDLLQTAKNKLGLDKGRVEITNSKGILEIALIFQSL